MARPPLLKQQHSVLARSAGLRDKREGIDGRYRLGREGKVGGLIPVRPMKADKP